MYRYVGFNAWQDNPPDGKHITPAFITKDEMKPGPDSYGPSVWVASKLEAQAVSTHSRTLKRG